jgi:hypothetical protein
VEEVKFTISILTNMKCTGLKPGVKLKLVSVFIETKRKPVPETYQTTHGAV